MKSFKDKRNNPEPFIFAERLTLVSWLFFIVPYLVREKLKGRRVYYMDASKPGLLAGRLTALFFPLEIEKLDFRMVDIHDDAGNLLRLRIAHFDFSDIQKNILSNPVFQNIDYSKIKKNRLSVFLAKQTASFDIRRDSTVFRAQFLSHIAAWKRKKEGFGESTACLLFMNERVWMREIKQYASQYNVRIIPVRNMTFNFKNTAKALAGAKLKILQSMYFYIRKEGIVKFIKQLFIPKNKGVQKTKITSPNLAVAYYGHLNLDRLELHSDLFFWQQSSLPGDNILITFNNAKDPLDNKKWQEIKKHSMKAVAFSPAATKISQVPVFYSWLCKSNFNITEKSRQNTPEKKWLERQKAYYSALYNYWVSFFDQHKVKVYVSWFKYDASHCVIADALEHLGGVTVNYQRGFEEFSSPGTAVDCDVAFGFSPASAKVEHYSNSYVPYYVITGYLGDHRFPLLKKQAGKVRSVLKRNGAKRIIAFFDENSRGNAHWHTGHEFMQVHYEFLLEKVLARPWLGLVFKPKIPSTLRRRLGKVADLLKRAEDTGRCYIFEGGASHGSYPPAVAALTADIAVHGDLSGATAGIEAALTGAPTLLMDREGWPISKFYNLNKGKVAFNNWPDLWKVCEEHWNTDSGLPGFGDWTPILDELDPFRDGKAAQRMGTYLEWLLEGFKAGLSRNTVMTDAAERYCKIWGKDKVIEIKNRLIYA